MMNRAIVIYPVATLLEMLDPVKTRILDLGR
jgi:hypothetical protein